MQLFGLHILDVGILAAYVLAILWIGKRVGRGAKDTGDFFIAGRRLGKFYQFFLNFGTSTSADQTATVTREIYRQGIGGMWIQFLVLFLTPFYWFTVLIFRRCRLITTGDYFTERFESRFLGAAFALFTIATAFMGGAASYIVAGKTLMALTPKPEEEYTEEERASVMQFREYQALKATAAEDLDPEQRARFDELNERMKRKELHAFVSYTDEKVFYLVYALIVAAYTVLGGFMAAAVTDAIQGCLIIVFSLMLIPIGLGRIGGFEGLHASVPDYMFELFGSASTSEYAWYTILAMITANLVSIVAAAPMMATAGSARDETTARIGMIGGMFFKRFLMLFWALAGLLAIGLYSGVLHDPDMIWGHMTRELLFPGAIGLMLVGILAANMSSLDAQSVTNSALFIRNLYQPLFPDKSERHYINVGRVVIVVVILGGMYTATQLGDLLQLFKYFISLPAVFGAAIWLSAVWRRLSRWAVILQVVICFSLYAVIPITFQFTDIARHDPGFLIETRAKEAMIKTGALEEDVAQGKAEKVGQSLRKLHVIEPTGIFFDKVVLTDPSDPGSPKQGQGRFHAEIWVLSRLGIDFSGCTKAELTAVRFFFDALFPFVLLFLVSLFTRPVRKERLDYFFAKIHTPIQPGPEKEREAIEHARRHPEIFEEKKIWPGSNWEILKPSKMDWIGFGGSWVLVGVVVFLLWVLANIGG